MPAGPASPRSRICSDVNRRNTEPQNTYSDHQSYLTGSSFRTISPPAQLPPHTTSHELPPGPRPLTHRDPRITEFMFWITPKLDPASARHHEAQPPTCASPAPSYFHCDVPGSPVHQAGKLVECFPCIMARQAGGGSLQAPPPPFAPCRRGSGSCHVSSFSGPLRFGNLYPRTPLPSPPAGESTSPQHLPTHRVGMFTRLGRYKILIRSLADTSLAPIDGWTHASPSLPAPSCSSPPVPVAHVVPSPILQVAAPPVSGSVFSSVFLFSCASSGENRSAVWLVLGRGGAVRGKGVSGSDRSRSGEVVVVWR